MSADNWTVCPKCEATHTARTLAAKEAHATKLVEAYGKQSMEEYAKIVAGGPALPPPFADNTLREDYEIGIREGEFSVSYGARCTACGFKFTFKHKAAAAAVRGER